MSLLRNKEGLKPVLKTSNIKKKKKEKKQIQSKGDRRKEAKIRKQIFIKKKEKI